MGEWIWTMDILRERPAFIEYDPLVYTKEVPYPAFEVDNHNRTYLIRQVHSWYPFTLLQMLYIIK
jgi:hypothetical protein